MDRFIQILSVRRLAVARLRRLIAPLLEIGRCVWRVDPAPNDPVLRGQRAGPLAAGVLIYAPLVRHSRRIG
jgi:hypothetical protein